MVLVAVAVLHLRSLLHLLEEGVEVEVGASVV